VGRPELGERETPARRMLARMPHDSRLLTRRIVNAIASSSRPSLLGTSKVGNNPSHRLHSGSAEVTVVDHGAG